MGFGCTKCGACCRLAGLIAIGLGVEFPYSVTEEGCCEKYDESVGCTIYQDRPEMCRTRYTGAISDDEYNRKCAQACNTMMDLLEIDESFKIKI